MKIFVLGAGRMGFAIVDDLVRTVGSDLELGICDVDIRRAQELAGLAGAIGQPYEVDVLNTDELSSILKRYDAVVNATWYQNNLKVMKACLQARCNYNDLGGLYHMTRKQLMLDAEAKSQGISAVVGGGESPGITNVMCQLAAEDLTSVESVKIYAGAKEVGGSGELVFPFSASTVIDEYTKNPVEFLDGNYLEVPALSGEEELVFPEPVGRNICHYSIHSEPATLPSTIGKGTRSVEFRLGISEKMVRTLSLLMEIGMLSDEKKIPVGGKLVSPHDFIVSFFNLNSAEQHERWVALKTVVTGALADGGNTRVTCDLVAAPGSHGFKNATAYLTGVAGSIFGQFLAEDKIEWGVIPPELAVDPSIFVDELEKRGIEIDKKLEFVD